MVLLLTVISQVTPQVMVVQFTGGMLMIVLLLTVILKVTPQKVVVQFSGILVLVVLLLTVISQITPQIGRNVVVVQFILKVL